MKKNFFYMFLLMAIAVMPLTSCDNDDSQPEKDRREVKAYDALEWLQGSLVVVDENNEVLRRVCGKALDESQPTVVSVPVADYDAAEKLFLGWVAPDKEATKVNGGYDYNLTDAHGSEQGSVSFRAVDGDASVIARVTVAEGTDLKQVTEVKFVNANLWPENESTGKYEAGKIYRLNERRLEWSFSSPNNDFYGWPTTEELPFYCIQGNTNGKEAILVWICPDENEASIHPWPSGYINRDLYVHLPSVPEAEKVLEFYNANYAAWEKMLKEMDALGYLWSPNPDWGGETTDRSEFILNSYDKKEREIKYLDLDGKTAKFRYASRSSWYYYRYMLIKTYPPVEE